MKRSNSSASHLSSNQRRTLFPSNRGMGGFTPADGAGNSSFGLVSKPLNASASAAGRSLLDRPKISALYQDRTLEKQVYMADFPKSAAQTPIPRVRTSSDVTLKSCVSSKSLLSDAMNSHQHQPRRVSTDSGSQTMKRNVSFSEVKVREYEVTLGDNPSVTSGAPLSLGWRHKEEKTTQFNDIEGKLRRGSSDFRLSDRERQRRLALNPTITSADLTSVLRSVAEIRLERKESLNELRQMVKKGQEELLRERQAMRERRVQRTYQLNPGEYLC